MNSVRLLLTGAVALVLASAQAGADTVVLTNAGARAEIALAGATAISYVPAGGEEVFFRAPGFRPGTEAFPHGGMPIAWPWFGRKDGSDSGETIHGFVRSLQWKVREASASRAVLTVESSGESRKRFPHDFRLTCEFRLDRSLSAQLTMENTGTEPMPFSSGFHPFFRVSGESGLHVSGIEGLAEISPSMDKAFPAGKGFCTLFDPVKKRTFEIRSTGAFRFCVWNDYRQWPEIYAAGGGGEFCCIEPLLSRGRGIMETLRPNESRSLSIEVSVSK